MRFTIYLLLGLLLFSTTSYSQEKEHVPFSALEKHIKSQQGGWNSEHDIQSKLFNAERNKLGERFEPELLKYLDSDAERHYWIASFLVEPAYLHGNKPLPQLSMQIMEQGINLLRDKTDEDSVGLTLSFNVIAAVLAQTLGLTSRATAHKNDVERQLLLSSDWGGFFPAITADDRKLYDSITPKTVSTSLPVDDSPDRPTTRVTGGVLNGRASVLPVPHYPPHVDASGQVVVSIVYDEGGKVIWARAISGPPPLLEFAVEAALKTVFPPFTLEGKPAKVSGVLVYKFVR